MFLPKPVLWSVFSLLVPFARDASAQTIKIDDGVPGYSLSYALPEDLCWMNRLSVATPTTITSVEIMFGGVPIGRPVTICVWRDLGGFGDPNQALLLTSVQTQVKNGGQQTFARYDVPPAVVNGSFFVGAVLSTNANFDPATMELVEGIDAQIDRVFRNLQAVAQAAGGSFDDVVRVTVYLTDLGHFGKVNETMARYFREPYPARAAIGVASLPRGALVEIDAVMHLG